MKSCREQHDLFLKTGVVTNGLLQTCIVLAQLDVVFRRKILVSDFLQFNEGDLQDLKQLINVVPRNMFDHQNLCLLDPTFGEGSSLVSGADVDLIIDDMIIDIKTTKKPLLQRQHFHQIVGYYMLYRIGSINGAPEGHSIQRLGIYFSRFATLQIFNIQDIVPDDKFNEFLPWFVDRAKTEFGSNSTDS